MICCKGSTEQAMTETRRLMEQLKLTVNETKTHIRELPQERFDFLSYNFGRYYSPRTGRAHLRPQPSKKSVQRMIGEIREATDRRQRGTATRLRRWLCTKHKVGSTRTTRFPHEYLYNTLGLITAAKSS